jgi:hypothetical protein
MNIGEDYKFRDDIKEDTVPIELLTGPYKGVILRYVQVFVKENEDDTATLGFKYDLLGMGNHTETALRTDRRFEKHIGIILNRMILEATEHTTNEYRDDNPKVIDHE